VLGGLGLAGLMLGALPAGCSLEENEPSCTDGKRGCPCESNGSCDDGLVCEADRCVAGAGRGGAGSGGNGGTAGNGGTSGTSNGGSAGGGRAGMSAGGSMDSSGGTGSNEGGAGADGDDGGSAGESSTAGEGGRDTADAGAGGADDSGGTAGSGGRAGSSNGGAGGSSAGTSGAGGSAGSGGETCHPITLGDPISFVSAGFSSVAWEDMTVPAESSLDGVLQLEFYEGMTYDGQLTGTFLLGTGSEANYKTCSRCLVAVSGERRFFATSGTLVVAEDSEQMQGAAHGSVTSATLREVTIDPASFESTLVAGGACLTLASVVFDSPPPRSWECPDFWYNDGECDCGCQAPDYDCENATFAACDACWCGDAGSNCNAADHGVDPTDNSECVAD
jgi:hypothetical protein